MYTGLQLRNILYSLIVLSLAFSLSCTRKQEGSAKIKVDMSGLGKTLSTSDIFFTALNVTGPGLSTPLLKNWERCHDCTTQAPSTIEVELPKGSGYLFQFLAVAKDSTGRLIFSYGDAKKDLNLANESVGITIAPVGTGAKEGDLIGRYMTSSNVGPTGRVAMKYKPEGKPAMRILYESIFSGWFNSFLFLNGENTLLEFVLINPDGSEGETIFDSLTASSAELLPGPHLMKVQFPQGYRMFGNGQSEPAAEKDLYFGYFGQGANTKAACYFTSPSEVSGFTSDASGVTPIVWDTAPPVEASAAGVVAGGGNSSICTSQTAYTDALQFNHSQYMDNNGAGFEGPYATPDNADPWGSFFSSTLASTTLTLTWKYLPGVFDGTNPIAGTALYYKTNYTDSNNSVIDDGGSSYSCDDLDTKLGFTRVLLAGTTASYSIPNISKAMLEQNSVKVALCPYRNNSAVSGGIETFNDGIETHGFHHLTQASPGFKLVGSNTVDSEILKSNATLNSNDKLLKTAITNDFHNLMPHIGQHLLSPSDVQSISFSVDGGAWQNFSAGLSPSLNYNAGTFSAVSLNDAQIASAISSSANQTIKFKLTLNNPASFGLQSADYITPAVTLIGADNCVSPTLKIKKLSDGTYYDNATFLTEAGFSTSYNESFKLVWTGSPACDDATAAIDKIVFSGNEVCLSKERDVYFDPAQPFAFRVDPKDRMGADCSLSTYGPTGITIVSPSNAGIDNISRSLTSLILAHSTTPSQLSPYLISTNPASPTSPYFLGLSVKKWIAYAGNSFSAKIIKENDDGRIVDTTTSTSFAGAMSGWTISGNHMSPSSATSDYVTLTASTPSDPKTYTQSFTGASTTGKLLTAARNTNDAVVFVADQHFWGHSPLVITKDASNNHSVSFMPNNSGNFEGNSIKLVGNAPVINTTMRVFAQPLPGNSNTHSIFALGYENKVYMVAVSHDTMSAVWSSAIVLTSGQEVVGMAQQGSANGLLVFAKQASSEAFAFYAMDLSGYTFNGTSWTTPPSEAAFSLDANLVPFDAVKCGDKEIAVVGRDYSDPSIAKAFIYDPNSIASPVTTMTGGTAFLGAQNRGACMRYHAAFENEPIYTFAYYSDSAAPSSVPLKMLSYNFSGNTQCGMLTNEIAEPVTTSFGSLVTAAIGPVAGFGSGLRFYPSGSRIPYFFGAFPMATETGLHRFAAQCAGSFSVELETIGTVPNSAGISYMNHMHMGPDDKHAWIYGSSLGLLETLLD